MVSQTASATVSKLGGSFTSDAFDMQMILLALCSRLHCSGHVPEDQLLIELQKVRFAFMRKMYPFDAKGSFQRAMQSESILLQCLQYSDQSLAIQLFSTCKVVCKGLKANPQVLPGIYLAFGHQMWEWHPHPGTLQLCDSYPRARTWHAALAQERDTVVVCGGGFGSIVRRVTNSASLLVKTTGTWQTLGPMLKKRESHSAAFLQGKLYVCGGLNDELTQDRGGEGRVHGSLECFDPGTHSWTQLPRMSMRRYHHACVSHMGCLYVSGGTSPDRAGGEGPSAAVECYDPSPQRWSQKPFMSSERARPTAASVGDKLFACGGAANGAASFLECFDASLSFWAPIPFQADAAARTFLASTGCQGQLYILSHTGATLKVGLIRLQRFNPGTGEWTEMPLEVHGSQNDEF